MKMRPLVFCICFLLTASLSFGEEKKPFVASVDADGIQKVSMTGGEFFYDPAHIVVKVNVPVELSVKKESGFIPHDIVMDAPDTGVKFSESIGREPKVIKFTPTKTGKFPFYCSKKPPFMKSHKDRGMEGVLEVVE